MNLPMTKYLAKRFLEETLLTIDETRLNYPQD